MMGYAVEFIKFEDGRAEPVVVDRSNAEFATVEEAKAKAVVMFAMIQTTREAIGYRIVKNRKDVITTVIRGVG
jgi:hypothetical protein